MPPPPVSLRLSSQHLAGWCLLALLPSAQTQAAVTFDGSLGVASAPGGPQYYISSRLGHLAGDNLFHSFGEFSLEPHESALFSGPDTVQNIIGRVTGGKVSNIDGGLISTIPGAALYLFNPAGVVFGPNAHLDLGGSFHAGTADYLVQGEAGERFYAQPLQGENLSTAAPSAFGFLDAEVAGLEVRGGGEIEAWDGGVGQLRVAEGETLSLVGGSVNLPHGTYFTDYVFDTYDNPVLDDHGQPLVQRYNVGGLFAPGGQVNLAAIAGPGEVRVGAGPLVISLGSAGGEINLADKALIDVSGQRAGGVSIEAAQIRLRDTQLTSQALAPQWPPTQTDPAAAGSVSLRGAEVYLGAGVEINTGSVSAAAGSAVQIHADRQLLLTDGANIRSTTEGSGAGGAVSLHGGDSLELRGAGTGVSSSTHSAQYNAGRGGDIRLSGGQLRLDAAHLRTYSEGEGDGGDISLESASLRLQGGAELETNTHAQGRGGDIRVHAEGAMALYGDATQVKLNTTGGGERAGDAGSLRILAETIELDQARLDSGTFGAGRGGDISLVAADRIRFSQQAGVYLDTTDPSAEAGDAGHLSLQAGRVQFDSGLLDSGTSGAGRGGGISVQARESVELVGSVWLLDTLSPEAYAGSAGDLQIQTGRITLLESTLDSSTYGAGDSGHISLRADGEVSLDYAGVSQVSWSTAQNSGRGGDTEVEAQRLHFSSSYIDAGTAGSGNGGEIQLRVGELVLEGGSYVTTLTEGLGQGGNILVQVAGEARIEGTDDLGLASFIDSGTKTNRVAQPSGDAGQVVLQAERLVLRAGGQLTSSTSAQGVPSGNAGSVQVRIRGELLIEGVNPYGENLDGFGSGVYVRSTGVGAGDSGQIDIEADALTLRDGGVIESGTGTHGAGGDIHLRVSGDLDISGDASGVELLAPAESQLRYLKENPHTEDYNQSHSGVYARSTGTRADAGAGGNIRVQARRLEMRDGARLSTSSLSGGKAGNIEVRVETLNLDGRAAISSQSLAINLYHAADLADFESRTLQPGDLVEVADVGGGKIGRYVYVQEQLTRVTPVFNVASEAELQALPERYQILKGDVVEVGTVDTLTDYYLYSLDPESGAAAWVRFDLARANRVLPDLSSLENGLGYFAAGESLPYANGLLLKLEDAGAGKSAHFVYTVLELPDGSRYADLVRLTYFVLRSPLDIPFLETEQILPRGTQVVLKDRADGTERRYVYQDAEWQALGSRQVGLDSLSGQDSLIRARTGNVVQLDRPEAGVDSLIYSGERWLPLGQTYALDAWEQSAALAPAAGDVVELSASANRVQRFVYTGQDWRAFAGGGDAGVVELSVAGEVNLNRSSVSTSSVGAGNGGDITLSTARTELSHGSSVSSQSLSSRFGGSAGTIGINASDRVNLRNSALTTEALSAGGGQIRFSSENTLVLAGSQLTTSVRDGRGNGGDLGVDSEFVVLHDGQIIARAYAGNGGNINITATGIYQFPNGDNAIDASSRLGVDGVVDINSPDVDTSGGLVALPENYLDTSAWEQQPCSARTAHRSSLVVGQRPGVPTPADDWASPTPLGSFPPPEPPAGGAPSPTGTVSPRLNPTTPCQQNAP